MADIGIKINGNTSHLDKKISNLKKKFKEFGKVAAIGAGVAATAFVALTKKVIDLGDNIGKAAKRMGVSAEAFQKLSFAANRAGASADTVEKAFKRMSSVIKDAEDGLTENVRALASLGLSFEDLKGKAPEKQFDIIAERLAMIEDFSLKSALAQDVFGRAGTAIIPMLDNYKALGDELEKINGIMSNESVEAAEQLKDDMENLERSFTALTANSGVVKWLSDISGGLNEILKSGNKVETFFRNFVEALRTTKVGGLVSNKIGEGLTKLGLGAKTGGSGAIKDEDVQKGIAAKEEHDAKKKLVNEKVQMGAIEKAREKVLKSEKKLQDALDKDKAKNAKKLEQEREKMMKSEERLQKAIADDKKKMEDDMQREEVAAFTGIEEKKTNVLSDRFSRIGGNLGGAGGDKESLDKKRNTMLGKLVDLMKREDTNNELNGDVMI